MTVSQVSHSDRISGRYHEKMYSVTTPLDLEINGEYSTELLASPLFPQEREASADRSHAYHSQKENLMIDSSKLQTSTERPVASWHSELERSSESILEEWRQQLLSETHSEILKREFQVEKAEADLRELQRRIQSTRMKLAARRKSHEENEQVLFEDLFLQQGALREIRTGGSQRVEELKSIQERRLGELSKKN